MKKLIFILISATIILTCTGCGTQKQGSSAESHTKPVSNEETEETKTSNDGASIGWKEDKTTTASEDGSVWAVDPLSFLGQPVDDELTNNAAYSMWYATDYDEDITIAGKPFQWILISKPGGISDAGAEQDILNPFDFQLVEAGSIQAQGDDWAVYSVDPDENGIIHTGAALISKTDNKKLILIATFGMDYTTDDVLPLATKFMNEL